ncbi:MAG: hypothetical protein WAM39_16005, partial [Bryobacteraceae bacterium]
MSALAFEVAIIESEAAYKEALAITRELMQKENRTAEDTKRLKTWSILIRDYEHRRYPELLAKSEPKDILRFFLEENKISQSDIRDIPQSRISDILSGRREINVKQAHALG